MPTIVFSIPIATDKTALFRNANALFVIERREEFEASRRRLGITAERGFLQRTSTGDVAIVVFDVADPTRMLAGIATSSELIDIDFRQYLQEVFGLDLIRGPVLEMPEQVFCWQLDDSERRPGWGASSL
jgi:hypothetical protein